MTNNFQFYRRIVRIILVILGVTLPFIKINGNHLLIFNIYTFEFHIFGLSLQINQFLPLLALFLFLTFLFLYLTVTFGRIWCGWLCPQSVSMELTSFMQNFNKGSLPIKTFKILFLSLLSVLIAANILLYFIPYEIFFDRLLGEKFSKGIFTALLTLGTLLFLNFWLVRYRFCATVCPYSMLQSMLFDKHTLAVWMIPERKDECINCLSCVKVCSTNIDIRQGQNSACINCAKCIDACAKVMGKLGKKSLFAYRFGENNKKRFTRFSSAVSLVLTLVSFFIFILVAISTKNVQVEVIPYQKFLPRYIDNFAANGYILAVENGDNKDKTIAVEIEEITGYEITPNSIFKVKPKSKGDFTFFIKLKKELLENSPILNLKLKIVNKQDNTVEIKTVSFRRPITSRGSKK